ncbi:CocE/NonD family hydrolase [Crocinitomicaceae bacterium]|nr:CocE/NonD family hydrolase [Crocinitomicaceae bacterium]MDB3906594.1 CocE/NonD family hydrolase [Crocinitomicaceae bacterium]
MKLGILLFLQLFAILTFAQNFTIDDYEKEEVYIEMRDGVKLFTSVYTPKDKSQKYPVLIKRTPYSVKPYGADTMPQKLMHNTELVASGYIFVNQDMRGRWMSEGEFENTKPPYSWSDKKRTDEVTDSYDTFDWLKKNLKNFNGNIGQYGNSYLGHTSLVSAVTGHPNLKAVLGMAPVTNFYFEDFNRYGLLGLNYLPVLDAFGIQKEGPTTESWYSERPKPYVIDQKAGTTVDYYDFFLERMALTEFDDVIHPDNFFWKNITEHPNYDAYRQERNWLQYLDRVQCPTLVVGGWTDEQNLFGIVKSFREMEENAEPGLAKLVLGPWSHGHPKRREGSYRLADIFYGDSLCEKYQSEVEFRYFEYHLKERGADLDFTAKVFNMGTHTWEEYNEDPFAMPKDTVEFFLNPEGSLSNESTDEGVSFISDPYHPVPFISDDNFYRMAPKKYMNGDQRFASKRPDVLTYTSEVLKEDVDVSGEIKALIDFATDHQDADVYVKIIDVLPMDRQPDSTDVPGVKMNGYQKLVRVGYIRSRFRDDFSAPVPFESNVKDEVDVPLIEVRHTFQKGHRIMIQVQSSMFPLFDLNPQNYVENIYEAEKEDFEKAEHTVYGSSRILLPVVKSE